MKRQTESGQLHGQSSPLLVEFASFIEVHLTGSRVFNKGEGYSGSPLEGVEISQKNTVARVVSLYGLSVSNDGDTGCGLVC